MYLQCRERVLKAGCITQRYRPKCSHAFYRQYIIVPNCFSTLGTLESVLKKGCFIRRYGNYLAIYSLQHNLQWTSIWFRTYTVRFQRYIVL